MLSYLPLAHILERLNSEVRLYCAGNPLWFAASIAEMPAEVRDLRPTCFVGVPRVWEKMATTIESAIDALPATTPPDGALGDRRGATGCRSRPAWRVPVDLPQRIRHRLADRLVLRRIREETGLDQAHTLITGAAPISPHVLRFFHALGLEILEGYGMSENMTVTTLNRRGHARLGTVGQVVPGVELRIAGDGEILHARRRALCRLLQGPGGAPRKPWSAAGCTPATSASSTRMDTCGSRIERRI